MDEDEEEEEGEEGGGGGGGGGGGEMEGGGGGGFVIDDPAKPNTLSSTTNNVFQQEKVTEGKAEGNLGRGEMIIILNFSDTKVSHYCFCLPPSLLPPLSSSLLPSFPLPPLPQAR